jgi:phosphoribosylformylglycinamidine cyclo-ligase
MNKYDTIGQDLVNHCVNDIFVQGGIPQIFNDYIGVEKMNPDVIKQIITGMSKACIENEMSLIGGEMAEMPGIYQNNDLDITGTIIGLVEKENIITGENITKDDVVIGFNSSGLHTNGYSLARNIVFEKLKLDVNDYVEELDEKIGEALLKVHISYYQILKEFAINKQINGMAHITGGGLIGNIKRIIPDGLVAEISCNSWETPKLFNWLVEKGNIDSFEAYQAFNMGIGFVVITDKVNGDIILKETNGFVIGEITDRKLNDKVILKNYEI